MKDEEDGRGEGVKARERMRAAAERIGAVRVWECIGARRRMRHREGADERVETREWCGFGNASEHADNAEPDKAPETSSVGMSKDKQQCDEAQ